MADVLVLAERLGKELAQDQRTSNLKDAQKALEEDKEAQELMAEYQKQAVKMAELERDGKVIEVADKHAWAAAQEKISLNETLKELTRRQMDFVDMMRKVKEAIDKQLQIEM